MRLGSCLVQKLAEPVQVSLGLVGLVDEPDDSRRERRALFIGVPVMADSGMVVTSPDRDVAEHNMCPRAVAVVAPRPCVHAGPLALPPLPLATVSRAFSPSSQ